MSDALKNIGYNKSIRRYSLSVFGHVPKSCSKMLRIDRLIEFAYMLVLFAQERFFFTASNLRGTDFAPRQLHEIMD